mgnify:FL=1
MKINKYSKKTAFLGAVLTMLLAPSAFAAETMAVDLDTAIAKAFATNADIKIAEYNLDSARATYNAARESYGPSISFTHNMGRGGLWDNDDFLKTGPRLGQERLNNSYSTTVKLTMPIYTGGQLEGNTARARANYRAKVLGEDLSYINLKKKTTDAYFNLLQAKDAKEVCEQSVSTLKNHLKNVRAQYEVGVVAKVDLLRSEVELTNAEQNLIKAQNKYDLAEANLDNIMGVPQDTKLVPKEELGYAPYDGNLDECIDYAMVHRRDLQQSKLRVDAARGALNIAKSGYRPQVAGIATNNWKDSKWPGDENENWSVGLNVNMTVFDTGVTRSKVNAAKNDLLAAQEAYRQDMDLVKLDVRSCYYDLRDAEKRIATTKVAVAKAEEDYHIAQVRYEAGVGTNTDVLDAQVALTGARNNFNSALYDYNASRNALNTAMGIAARPEGQPYSTGKDRVKTTRSLYKEAVATTDGNKAGRAQVKAAEKSRSQGLKEYRKERREKKAAARVAEKSDAAEKADSAE